MTRVRETASAVAPNTAKAMADHWNDRADRFQKSPSHPRLREVWDSVFTEALGPGGVAIDLGCGPGACALAMAELGFQVLAADSSTFFEQLDMRADPDVPRDLFGMLERAAK